MDKARLVEPAVRKPVALVFRPDGTLSLLVWGRGLPLLVGQRVSTRTAPGAEEMGR